MIRNFEFTDVDGIKKEASVYTTESFKDKFDGNKNPIITNENGVIDPSLFPASISSKATSLVIQRVASEEIVAGELLYPTVGGEVGLADNNRTLPEARVIGMAMNTVAVGGLVDIILLGVVFSQNFSVFNVLDTLYLDEFGGITNVKPTNKYLVTIGRSLGENEILIEIKEPIVVGV